MYELCNFLKATTKTAKPARKSPAKPRAKKITVGAACIVMGHNATVVGPHANKGWWNIDFGGKVMGFDRSLIEII